MVLTGGTHFLLARNGRGKTTLLRTLAGTLRPVTGKFRTAGFVQYLPEDLRFDPEITPAMVFRMLLPKARLPEARELAGRIELDVKKPYGRLSTGNRRKTSLIMAEFSVKPDAGNILLLDEPFSGLDAFARQAFEETNLRVQHVLTAETPGGQLARIDIDVPVLYQSRNLRWTAAEVPDARALLIRLADYQEKSRTLRGEGVALLDSWNRLVGRSIPAGDLRADSSTLPVNQLDAAGAPRPAGLNTIESIQIQPSIK